MAQYQINKTGAEIEQALDNATKVVANPTLAGTETSLSGIEIAGTKYAVSGGGASLFTSITYADFVLAVNNSQLIPGMQYRITDYVTKINGVYDLSIIGQTGAYLPYATSAEHQFDIIITATGTNTYNENVKAIQHSGDTYFEHSNLSAWEVKWMHKNDRSQYSFADETNGKGVIYYMKDEFDNEAFFDFKNIMNLNFALRRINSDTEQGEDFEYDNDDQSESYQPNRYGTAYDVFKVLQSESIGGNLEFDVGDLSGTSLINLIVFIRDISKTTLDNTMDWTYVLAGLSQMMGTTVTLEMLAQMLELDVQVLEAMTERQVIQNAFNADFYYTFNLNLEEIFYDFTSYYNYDSEEQTETYGGAYCWSNHLSKNPDLLTSYFDSIVTIPNGLSVTTFENIEIIHNYGNSFGANSMLSVFGNNCICNRFGELSMDNRLATQCCQNTFSNCCQSNWLGVNCNSNSFGNGCINNSLGMSNNNNSFGDNCDSNLFLGWGNDGNKLGNSCQDITLISEMIPLKTGSEDGNCCFNIFGNDCGRIILGPQACYNIFGNDCSELTFGGSGDKSLYYSQLWWGIFESYLYRVELKKKSIPVDPDTGDEYSEILANVKICHGVRHSVIFADPGYTPVEYKSSESKEIVLSEKTVTISITNSSNTQYWGYTKIYDRQCVDEDYLIGSISDADGSTTVTTTTGQVYIELRNKNTGGHRYMHNPNMETGGILSSEIIYDETRSHSISWESAMYYQVIDDNGTIELSNIDWAS